jgi:nucleotide-binding universal stress UspA family protein
MYRKILVPMDGSDTAARGLEEAINLAKVTGGSLRLVHVIDAFPVAGEMMTSDTWAALMGGLQQAGGELLARAAAKAAKAGIDASTRVAEMAAGRVADVILGDAKASGCDLIVMGTHGRRGFKHLMLGSDAERVLQLSALPVLLVRHAGAGR